MRSAAANIRLVSKNWCLPKIVIVGAGMAGLTAAQRLATAGISDITILEACEKPGGRIRSCKMGECIVELGAPLLNGMLFGNPIVSLIKQSNLPYHRRVAEQGIFIDDDGDVVPEKTVEKALRTFSRVERRAKDIFRKPKVGNFGTLKEFFNDEVVQEINRYEKWERNEIAATVDCLLGDVEARWGTSTDDLSASQYGSHTDLQGDDAVLPKGMSKLLAALISALPNCIHCNKPVMAIKWSPSGCVVKTCDGQDFPADYVIVTVSLGVLKKHHLRMFCPQLPYKKQEAIAALGYGHISKMLMHFERPFWVGGEGPVRWPGGKLEPVDNKTLVATMTGDEAIRCDNMADYSLLVHVLEMICRVLSDPTIPLPKYWTRTDWTRSNYFVGAVSHMSTTSTVGHLLKLAQPLGGVAPTLLFAGEATSPGQYGTVLGARESGLREAERIIQLTRLHCGKPPRPKPCYF